MQHANAHHIKTHSQTSLHTYSLTGTRVPIEVTLRWDLGAGWSSPVARQAHNLKVTGSNPVPATTITELRSPPLGAALVHGLVEDDCLPGLRRQLDPVEFLRAQVGAAPRASGLGICAVRSGQPVKNRGRAVALVWPDRFIHVLIAECASVAYAAETWLRPQLGDRCALNATVMLAALAAVEGDFAVEEEAVRTYPDREIGVAELGRAIVTNSAHVFGDAEVMRVKADSVDKRSKCEACLSMEGPFSTYIAGDAIDGDVAVAILHTAHSQRIDQLSRRHLGQSDNDLPGAVPELVCIMANDTLELHLQDARGRSFAVRPEVHAADYGREGCIARIFTSGQPRCSVRS